MGYFDVSELVQVIFGCVRGIYAYISSIAMALSALKGPLSRQNYKILDNTLVNFHIDFSKATFCTVCSMIWRYNAVNVYDST